MTKMPVKIDGYFFMKILAFPQNFAKLSQNLYIQIIAIKTHLFFPFFHLLFIGAQLTDGFAANTLIVHLHLINDDHGGGRIFVKHFLQQFGDACYQLRFLGRRGGFIAACDFDIDIGHGTSFCML